MKSFSYKQRAWASLIGIVAVFGACAYFTTLDIYNAGAFVIAVIGCYSLARYLWCYIRFEMRNPVRILRKSLPKCGFKLTKTEWNSDFTTVRIFGTHNGGDYVIEASPSQEYVRIEALPWLKFKTCDPIVPFVLEAINNTNARRPNISVVLEDSYMGERRIYTITRVILPVFKATRFLENLLMDFFNCKSTLVNNIKVECPRTDGPSDKAVTEVLQKDYCLN